MKRKLLNEDEQALWGLRARRLTEHALYHMGDVEVFDSLEMALVCMHIQANETGPDELEPPFPGDDDYDCPYVYLECGFKPSE
jgi:hypothetical protein